MSTGLGKSLTSFALVENFIRVHGYRVLFVVHKVQLVEQVLEDVRKIFNDVGSICGSLEEEDRTNTPLVVGSIQTLVRRPPDENFDLIVLDESHRVDQKKDSQYMRFLKSQPDDVKIMGMTATPYRAAGGYIYGKDRLWESISYNKGLLWAIENKWLVPPRLKHTKEQFDTSKLRTKMGDFDQKQIEALSLDIEKVRAQIKDALVQLTGRKKIIWHCTCIEHANLVQKILSEEHSEEAITIHSEKTKQEQDKLLEQFEFNSPRHLTFVMIISEGVDIPCIDAIVLMRPTKSPVLYVQAIGRGLRLFEGKEDCLVLDYGQVIKNCGPLDSPYLKSDVVGRKLPKDASSEMKFCPMCLEYMQKAVPNCPECNHDFIAAMLANQKDRLKNLTKKASVGVLLSSEEKKEIKYTGLVVSIDPSLTKATWKTSKNGNQYIRISYWVEDMQQCVHDFITFGMNRFQVANNYERLATLLKKQVIEVKRMSMEDIVRELNKTGFVHIKQIAVKQDPVNEMYWKVKKIFFREEAA
jgi:DNA repair protein RadD